MKKLYLIRHGQPELPQDGSFCLGRTDLPLSRLGKMQAFLAAEHLKQENIETVYCCSLKRALETAEFFGRPVNIISELTEQYMGDWDGLSFSEIKTRYPELYNRRGEDLLTPIPNFEPHERAYERFERALRAIAQQPGEAAAVIIHRSVSSGLLSSLSGLDLKALMPQIAYGSVSLLDGELNLLSLGIKPRPELTQQRTLKLMELNGASGRIIAHCEAVAELSATLAAELGLDAKLCYTAALLHDISRSEKDHAKSAAELMKKLGYSEFADIIAQHHELKEPERIDEAAVVYIADKQIKETEFIGLEARFSGSLSKCVTEEAKTAHETRYRAALTVKNKINDICGREAVT